MHDLCVLRRAAQRPRCLANPSPKSLATTIPSLPLEEAHLYCRNSNLAAPPYLGKTHFISPIAFVSECDRPRIVLRYESFYFGVSQNNTCASAGHVNNIIQHAYRAEVKQPIYIVSVMVKEEH